MARNRRNKPNQNQTFGQSAQSNTPQTNYEATNHQQQTRSDFIEKTIARKKQVVEDNRNAQVFVSDSIAGTEIFNALRKLDTIDSAIRRLWGNGVDSSEAEQWVKNISELRNMASDIEKHGIAILSKCPNLRRVGGRYLQLLVERSKEQDEPAEEVDDSAKNAIGASKKKGGRATATTQEEAE